METYSTRSRGSESPVSETSRGGQVSCPQRDHVTCPLSADTSPEAPCLGRASHRARVHTQTPELLELRRERLPFSVGAVREPLEPQRDVGQPAERGPAIQRARVPRRPRAELDDLPVPLRHRARPATPVAHTSSRSHQRAAAKTPRGCCPYEGTGREGVWKAIEICCPAAGGC